MQILIVDDEQPIVDLLTIYLTNERYDILTAHDGREALDMIHKHRDTIDLILLDQMLPEIPGETVLRTIRDENIHIPVIIISAKVEEHDRISGLFSGADDYITKPFNALEVIARIKSILRRQMNYNNYHNSADQQNESAPTHQEGIIQVGPITINQPAHTVQTESGETVDLTNLEFDILYFLASNQGVVYSAEEILNAVWGEGATVNYKTVMVHVSHLRDKIEAVAGDHKIIHTVWGVGYKVEA